MAYVALLGQVKDSMSRQQQRAAASVFYGPGGTLYLPVLFIIPSSVLSAVNVTYFHVV